MTGVPLSDREEERAGRSMSLVQTLVEGGSKNRWETRKRHLSLQFCLEDTRSTGRMKELDV